MKRDSACTVSEDWIMLRALIDCNVPKFLAGDVPLFEGIIADLFPGVLTTGNEDPNIDAALREACRHYNLQCTPNFIRKCFQLYDTTRVRHGLMLVGPTGGGKSCCLKVLARALTSLAESVEFLGKYEKVVVQSLNPKSITMGEMYGESDPQTREFKDGIVSVLVRNGIAEQTTDSKWYVFDGPVDAIWIESMNTVLDDNKKLCLTCTS